MPLPNRFLICMVAVFHERFSPKLETYGADSVTNYNWGGSIRFDGDYPVCTEEYLQSLQKASAELSVPYYPNLSVGWDNNVRFHKFIPGVVENNVLRAPLITVNSWNEWTETRYLQPDDLYGYGYLEAIRDVFGG